MCSWRERLLQRKAIHVQAVVYATRRRRRKKTHRRYRDVWPEVDLRPGRVRKSADSSTGALCEMLRVLYLQLTEPVCVFANEVGFSLATFCCVCWLSQNGRKCRFSGTFAQSNVYGWPQTRFVSFAVSGSRWHCRSLQTWFSTLTDVSPKSVQIGTYRRRKGSMRSGINRSQRWLVLWRCPTLEWNCERGKVLSGTAFRRSPRGNLLSS